ncbi:collagen-binding domain-containing protein [Actinosynnema sp. NPDC004786]
MQISRIGAVGVAAAVALAAAAIGWASDDRSALAAVVNPLRPVAPDDVVADPSHGFLVLVEGDASLYENETEGPVAIGGDVRFRVYNAGPNHPGAYVLPGDTRPTSLVIGGRPLFEESGTGTLRVLDNSYAKIGDLSGASVLPSGGVTHVVPAGGNEGTLPAVQVQTSQPAASVGGPSGFDFPALFALYRGINADVHACAPTVQLRDGNGQNPWNGTDPGATLGLRPGQNVLTLTGAQLDALEYVNPLAGGLQPGDEAWLIVNVQVSGDYTFAPPNVSWQGNAPSTHVLWNFTTSGTITLPEQSNTVWGTVYAPNATLVDHSSNNIEGAVVVKSLVQGGPVVGGGSNGGEIHYAPFVDDLTTCAEPTSTTTTTTTTTSATTTTTTSATTTTTTSATTTTSTTAGTTTATTATTTTTAAETTSGTTGTTGTTAPVVRPEDGLADTGAGVRGTLVAGGLLVLSGVAALALTRRRDRRGRPADPRSPVD